MELVEQERSTSPEADVSIRKATRGDDEYWDALEGLLKKSFGSGSLRPVADIRPLAPVSSASSAAFYPTFYGAWQGDDLVGFIAAEYLFGERVLYLWYMATAPEFRSMGIGATLLKSLTHTLIPEIESETGDPVRAIAAEVEAFNESESSPDSSEAKRVRFYERHGFARQDVVEVAPPFGPGDVEPFRYWLYLRPLRDCSDGRVDLLGVLAKIFGQSKLNGRNPESLDYLGMTLAATQERHDPSYTDSASGYLGGSPWLRETVADSQFPCTWLTPKAETSCDPERGFGARAVEHIQANELVAVFGGWPVTQSVLDQLDPARASRSIQIEHDCYLVARTEPTPGDMFNHSCEPNCGLAGSQLLVAMRDIEPGEELSFDYAMCDASDYDEFRCLCGVPTCREVVSGSDWRDPALQAKYAGWFSPYLVRRIAALPTA